MPIRSSACTKALSRAGIRSHWPASTGRRKPQIGSSRPGLTCHGVGRPLSLVLVLVWEVVRACANKSSPKVGTRDHAGEAWLGYEASLLKPSQQAAPRQQCSPLLPQVLASLLLAIDSSCGILTSSHSPQPLRTSSANSPTYTPPFSYRAAPWLHSGKAGTMQRRMRDEICTRLTCSHPPSAFTQPSSNGR